MHTIEINERVCEPENGLIIGNGDLSVSVYQTEDMIIWRFGKNDVWDRRLDLSDCPEPAHIDEIARGVAEEKWINHGYMDGDAEALGEVSDPKRMKELCNSFPAYAHRPFPCPKPVGELALHIPIDLKGLKISQKINIEESNLKISLSWSLGAAIHLSCFVPPEPNALVVNWKVENWTDKTSSIGHPPVWFTLYRWPDPTVAEFAAKHMMIRAMYSHHFRAWAASPKSTPLPPPSVKEIAGRQTVEQSFYPDLEFKDGFQYAMVPFTSHMKIVECPTFGSGWAALYVHDREPALEGTLCVAVPTSTDESGVGAEIKRITGALGDDVMGAARKWEQDNLNSAREFWAKSSVEIEDELMENTWYETLHIRRSTYRAGVIAPGLALPSTLPDYTLWHGDYHMNYNYQQPFWADYTANHAETADSFFPGMYHMVELGRRMAKKYWDCRGTYIHITGYPFPVEDDPYGTGPLCRMAYMTGWVSNHYWRKYLYTLDVDWLREEGYPVMRDCALFYTDFVKKRDDGKYHMFPSLQGEAYFNGDVERFTDQPQVIRHTRYCFRTAIEAAQVLGVDEDLQEQWTDRRDNLMMVDDLDGLGFSEEEKRRYFINPPEFQGQDIGYKFPRPGDRATFLRQESGGTWGAIGSAGFPWPLLTYLHNRVFEADRDYDGYRDLLIRNRLPNGSSPAMSQQDHGYIGLYGESHGIIAPLQEMMLQSWDGVLRVFPAWPKHVPARFTTFRAENAFLVSATWNDGSIESLTITSEAGVRCRMEKPWNGEVAVKTSDGRTIETTSEEYDVISFETGVGETYEIVSA